MYYYAKLKQTLTHIICHTGCQLATLQRRSHVRCHIKCRVIVLLKLSQDSSMMVPQCQDKRKKGSDHQKSQLNRGETSRLRLAIAATMRVSDIGHLGQDVDGGDVEKCAGAEEHRDAGRGEGVQGLRAPARPVQAEVSGHGCQGSRESLKRLNN